MHYIKELPIGKNKQYSGDYVFKFTGKDTSFYLLKNKIKNVKQINDDMVLLKYMQKASNKGGVFVDFKGEVMGYDNNSLTEMHLIFQKAKVLHEHKNNPNWGELKPGILLGRRVNLRRTLP